MSEEQPVCKLVGIWITRADFLRLREEAARRKIGMGTLVKKWIRPHMERIPPAR